MSWVNMEVPVSMTTVPSLQNPETCPLVLPKQLEDIKPASELPGLRHRWNTNEEIASLLIAFHKHKEWQHLEMKIRPPSGSMLMYSRKKVRYRKDGYCWKKRKDGKNIREDHMKLKVQGLECIYGSYVHSDILPTFHRRCYWLLQNPDIVLVHYLNVPYPDNTKLKIPSISYTVEKKEWTKEELVDQLRPMFSTGRPGEDSDQMIEETVEALVKHLIEYHKTRERGRPHKCDKSCDNTCQQHSSVYKLSPRGSGVSSNCTTATATITTDTSTQCKNTHEQIMSALQQKSQQITLRSITSQGNCNVMAQQKKDLSCSQEMTVTPYIVNLGQYVVVNGHHDPRQIDVTVTSNGCQGQQISHLIPHSPNSTLPHTVPHQQHISPITYVPPHFPQQHGGKGQTTHLCSNNSVLKEHCNDMSISLDDSDTNKDKLNLVPHLQSVTADDVQNVIQSHVDQEIKDGLSDIDQSKNDIDSSLTGSLGTDFNFDILDLLEIQEDKTNPAVNNESHLNSFNGGMAGSIPALNCANCLSNSQQQQQVNHSQFCQSNSNQNSVLHPGYHQHLRSDIQKTSQQTEPINIVSALNTQYNKNANNQRYAISEFCPEWSFTEGGCKVLFIGNWCSASSEYICMFDGKAVPTKLVQPGVLRCYTPAHKAGIVTLQVSCDGTLSNSVSFEYKHDSGARGKTPPASCIKQEWFSLNENQLNLLLVDRLESLQSRMAIQSPDISLSTLKQQLKSQNIEGSIEEKLIWHVNRLKSCKWENTDIDNFPKAGPYNMTLLHLSAALGYAKLLQILIQWRSDNPCWILDYEVDAQCQDDHNCTALLWACAKGHQQAASTLYYWNSDAMKIKNKDGLYPLTVAQQYRHLDIVKELEKLEFTKVTHSNLNLGQDFISSTNSGSQFLHSPVKSEDTPLCTSTPVTKHSLMQVFKSPEPIATCLSSNLGSLHVEIPQPLQNTSQAVSAPIRRQSDLSLRGNSARKKLSKRYSVDICPSEFDDRNYSSSGQSERPVREAISEPHLPMATSPMTRRNNPMLADHGRDLTSPDMLMHTDAFGDQLKVGLDHLDALTIPLTPGDASGLMQMDTDEVLSSGSNSPIIDVEKLSSDDEGGEHVSRRSSDRHSISTDNSDDVKHQMVTLAKQIIAAIPERIKSSPGRDDICEEFIRERSSSYSSLPSQPSPHASSYEEDSGISTPMGDGFAFDDYRYTDFGTPASSLSPDSTCLPSPYSPYSFQLDSPPPTTAEFTEYFNAPATYMEKDFSQLTLSDQEQRKLYEAAKVIQNAYRSYRDKQIQQQQQNKEIEAAVLIQKYYRRYKQYAYYKKMTQAAVLIQSQFRSYYAQKRFKKSRDAAVVIQNQYRTYKEHERLKKGGNKSVIIQQRYRSHYQRKQMEAAQLADGQIVQIVPDSSSDSSQSDQNTTHTDNILHHQPDVEEVTHGSSQIQPENHTKD